MLRLSVLGHQLSPCVQHRYDEPAAAAAVEAEAPKAANGAARLVNADRSTMGSAGGAHGGPEQPELTFCSIFQGTTKTAPFAEGSPMAFVHACVIPPGGGIGLHTCDSNSYAS